MIKIFIIFIFLPLSLYSEDWVTSLNDSTATVNEYTLISEDPVTGLIIDQVLATTAVAFWGVNNWKWGTESFHVKTEDWFEYESQTGGSDKTGHFYMTYLLSRVMASRMQDRGWSLEEASIAGSLSGMLTMTLLEVGDGTSPYGFSKEDLLADALGSSMAYILRANPDIDDFIDIRLEYFPSSGYLNDGDATTDYSGMKHLLAFKLAGFDSLKHTAWSLVEFQVGYYSRGYRSYDDVLQSQHIYAGVGISLADLADRSNINVLKNIFEFYQPGYTYIETDIASR